MRQVIRVLYAEMQRRYTCSDSLFSFQLHSHYYIGSTLYEQMDMEFWWFETTRKRLKY
jgi:hypothetical protein